MFGHVAWVACVKWVALSCASCASWASCVALHWVALHCGVASSVQAVLSAFAGQAVSDLSIFLSTYVWWWSVSLYLYLSLCVGFSLSLLLSNTGLHWAGCLRVVYFLVDLCVVVKCVRGVLRAETYCMIDWTASSVRPLPKLKPKPWMQLLYPNQQCRVEE